MLKMKIVISSGGTWSNTGFWMCTLAIVLPIDDKTYINDYLWVFYGVLSIMQQSWQL